MPSDQRRVWDAIAASFDRTRPEPWPHVTDFLRRLPAPSRVLDVMAGNGRHTRIADDLGHDGVWLDWSKAAAKIATPRLRGAVVVGDAERLPFVDAAFDAVLLTAALHGIETPGGRAACLAEARRVLRPGGVVQMTVWSREAPRFCDLKLPAGPADVVVPWRANGLEELRHYHLYTRDELRRVVEAAGFGIVALSEVAIAAAEPDNLVLEARR